jgi:hypothetical protein
LRCQRGHAAVRRVAYLSRLWHYLGMRAVCFALLGVSLSAWCQDKFSLVRPNRYSGMANASAAVSVSSNLFVVADDEDNVLRLYHSDRGGAPITEFDYSIFLRWDSTYPEADLEGAAKLSDRAFWIGSYGRNKDGKERLSRRCLFATDIRSIDGVVTLTPVGRPYRRLLADLISDPRFEPFHLAEAAGRAPKSPGGLSIEGLSATPAGHLLIGFRNPIPGGKALLIPLLNPNEVIEGKPGRFDLAIHLDLGGLGIRDIAYHQRAYIIIAGSWHERGTFRLYRWAGVGTQPELLTVKGLKHYTPEAVVIYPDTGLRELQVLSDDGNRLIEGVPSKAIKDPRKKTFRSFWVVP